jgi:hypothetical protein
MLSIFYTGDDDEDEIEKIFTNKAKVKKLTIHVSGPDFMSVQRDEWIKERGVK